MKFNRDEGKTLNEQNVPRQAELYEQHLKAAQGGVSTVAVAASPAGSARSLLLSLLFLLFLTASPLHHLPQPRRSDGELLQITVRSERRPQFRETERQTTEGKTEKRRRQRERERNGAQRQKHMVCLKSGCF